MNRDFALCQGAGYPLCDTCLRNVERHPPAKPDEWQCWTAPDDRRECRNHREEPAK